jgi:hypothetical protein
MKVITSKLTTPQLEALAKQVLNAQDQRHVSYLMRSPEYFRNDLIQFITAKAGREPDQIVQGMAEAQLRKEQVKQKQQTQSDGGGVVMRMIDLSKQGQPTPQAPNTLVAVGCGGCGVRLSITVAELEDHGGAYCPKCVVGAAAQVETAEKILQQFLVEVPQFYQDPKGYNAAIMSAEIERKNLANPTVDDLIQIYIENCSRLLGRLKPEDVRAMTSQQYDQRLQQDPGMGGCNLDQAREGQQHLRGEATIHSSNKLKNWQLPAQGQTSGNGGGR